MTRFRVVGLLLTSSLLLASPLALAKKKKRPREFVPEEGASGDQPSKVLERAFKLYDGEDYLFGVDRAQQGRSRASPATASPTSRRPSSGWARPSTT